MIKVCEKHDCSYNYRTTKHGTCPACFAEAHCHNLEQKLAALKYEKEQTKDDIWNSEVLINDGAGIKTPADKKPDKPTDTGGEG